MSVAQRRLFQRGSPIWAYHKVGVPPAQTTDPFLYATPAQFDFHLARLADDGFIFPSLDEFLNSRSAPLSRMAVITFDDGFLDVLRNGLDVLARHKARAIQFLVAGALGSENQWDMAAGDTRETIMNAREVGEWLAAGHDIGSHSMTHRNLKRLSDDELKQEVLGSKTKLEDLFGVSVRHFAYPFGGYNQRVRDAVLEAGYASACTMDFGVNTARTPEVELRRIIPLAGRLVLGKVMHRLNRRFTSKLPGRHASSPRPKASPAP